MSDLPTLRVSDSDRDRAALTLREHCVAGRLSFEELGGRIDEVYAARTGEELEVALRELPASAPLARRSPRRLLLVLFGNTDWLGRWRVPRRARALVVFGDANIDFRQAEPAAETVALTAFLLFGNADFFVPEQVEVDFAGVTVFGHRRERGEERPPAHGAPLLRIRVYSLFGTADLWRVPPGITGRPRELVRTMLGRPALPR